MPSSIITTMLPRSLLAYHRWQYQYQLIKTGAVFFNWGSMEPKGSVSGSQGFRWIKSRIRN